MIELLEAYKQFPYTDVEIRIYEFRGKNKKLIDEPHTSGTGGKRLKVGKLHSLLVAATTLDCALAHLQECRPHFQASHANCCGVMYLHRRYPFGQELAGRLDLMSLNFR
jgi:hypothetical protein